MIDVNCAATNGSIAFVWSRHVINGFIEQPTDIFNLIGL
jgi:hypothetical protein